MEIQGKPERMKHEPQGPTLATNLKYIRLAGPEELLRNVHLKASMCSTTSDRDFTFTCWAGGSKTDGAGEGPATSMPSSSADERISAMRRRSSPPPKPDAMTGNRCVPDGMPRRTCLKFALEDVLHVSWKTSTRQ